MEVKQMNDSFFCENEGHYFFYDASTGFMSETSRVFNDVISAYRKYNNIEDAKKELSLTYNFSQIDGILDEVVQLKETFFGGEPLLNKEVFLYSLEYIESLLEGTGVIPTYAITTNGTLINDELIQIFLK